jgi:hypothetical protein
MGAVWLKDAKGAPAAKFERDVTPRKAGVRTTGMAKNADGSAKRAPTVEEREAVRLQDAAHKAKTNKKGSTLGILADADKLNKRITAVL